MTERTPDEVADSFRTDFADAHALVDASTHPKKLRLQGLIGGAHLLMERAAKILNDDGGSGDIAARAGDDKD
jgi:hypothetical protein